MTTDLTAPLAATVNGLTLGLPIEALNRLRRRDEEQQMADARETILWRLATARDRVRKLDAPADDDELSIWIGGLSRSERSTIATVLADQLALVTDCAAEIRQRDATIAELRGRVAALEAMTPGGGR